MLKRFWEAKAGSYAAIFCIAMVPIMSGVAGLVDYVGTGKAASKLQNSLDATALAMAATYRAGMHDHEVRQYGLKFFSANVISAGIDFNDSRDPLSSPDLDTASQFAVSTGSASGAVTITASAKLNHKGFIGGASVWQAKRQSVVALWSGEPACVLALDPHASAAVKMQGSTQVALKGCVAASNSDSASAISRAGAAEFTAKCVSVVGATSGLDSRTTLTCAKGLEGQTASSDPLSTVALPSYTACQSFPSGKTVTLSPATFCNQTWSGKVTLNEGTYVLRGGKIKLGGNGSLTGKKVTIFLLEGAEMVINANEVIDLTPPTVPPYAGITIYQEKGNTNELKINGTSGSNISGFVYAPSAHVFFAGNSNMQGSGDCVRIVAKTIEMTGNSAVNSDCSGILGDREIITNRRIALIK